MKRNIVLIFAMTALLCAGCSKAEDVGEFDSYKELTSEIHTEEQSTSAVLTEQATEQVTVENKYGIAGYDKDSLEQWHDLQEEDAYELIREVLLGEKTFYYWGDISGNNEGVTDMSDLLENVFENKADMSTWKMVFIDLDGKDGIKECVLRCRDSETHHNIIFHYSAGEVYATEFTYRDGKFIYANGVIEGSGSASGTYWNRICFERGERAVQVKEVGWDYGDDRTEAWITVDGILYEVPGEVCSAWRKENNFPGDEAEEYDFTEENVKKYIVK